MGVKWENRLEFFRKLNSVVPGIASELSAANMKSAEEMAATARRLVPAGDTGNLAASIRTGHGRGPTDFIVEAGGSLTTKNGYDYAIAIEFGSQRIPGGAKEQKAIPFFWPSYRIVRRTFRGRASRAIKKAIKAAGF